MITINHFSVKLDQFQLKNIDAEIQDNEIFAVLGKTGSGKTVLLESIAGFYQGDTGTILYEGKNVSTISPEKRKIGFVYQDYGLFPHMTVYNNIYYGLRMNKVSKKEGSKIVSEMAQALGIEHILNHYPGTLSGGERQRTALARALVLNPSTLLMDEPFSALDPNTKEQMYRLIKTIHEKFKCTIIFVTHDFNEAKRMADRVGLMINGELRTICSSDQLFNNHQDREVKDFLGIDELQVRRDKEDKKRRVDLTKKSNSNVAVIEARKGF